MHLNESDKKELLQIARHTLEKYLAGNSIQEIKSLSPVLLQKTGAFVTLHKQGELRGCIGHLISDGPLW